MRTTELGRTGEQVSALALGCMGMGTQADDETSFATLDAYAEDGGGFLDTADCYTWFYAQGSTGGQSEELIGRWLRRTGNRDRTFIATKGSGQVLNKAEAWPAGQASADWSKVRFVGAGAATLRDALEGSLRRLGVDHVDLYYVHVDDPSTPLEETLSALAGFVTAGTVRYLGWSNVATARLERIRVLCETNGWPQPVAVQQQHTFLRRPALRGNPVADDEQIDYLAGRGDVSLVAYSPLLKGAYDQTPARRAELLGADGYAGETGDPATADRLAALDQVAGELGASAGQVVLAWLAAQASPRTIPLIGSTKVSRYREAATAMDLNLTDAHLARLA